MRNSLRLVPKMRGHEYNGRLAFIQLPGHVKTFKLLLALIGSTSIRLQEVGSRWMTSHVEASHIQVYAD